MEYKNYEAAINALLDENQEKLLELSMQVSVALAAPRASAPVSMTLAELVALTLLEISREEFAIETVEDEPLLSHEAGVVVAPRVKLPTELLCYNGPVVVAQLVKWATESVN